jgi:hypothetical protein
MAGVLIREGARACREAAARVVGAGCPAIAGFTHVAERTKPFLGKVEIDGYVVGRVWYQDHVLASIRRMVDAGKNVVSIRQALLDVRQVADELTPSVLLEFHGQDLRWDEETNLRMSEEWVRLTVRAARPDEPEADTSAIGKRTIQADLDRIRDIADRAHWLATLVTAHRLDKEEQVTVTMRRSNNSLNPWRRSTRGGVSRSAA